MRTPYRLRGVVGGMLIGATVLTACSGGPGVGRPVPADMLLSPAALPPGFTSAPLTVTDLTTANAEQLATADSAGVVPPQCRPTADAGFNKLLTPANTAVLGATSLTAGLTEVASTATRDVAADIRVSTRDCATTTTTVTRGSLKGAAVTTEHVRLPTPALDTSTAGYVGRVGALRIVDVFVVRSTVTTRIADGSASKMVSLAGYATGRFVFDAPDTAPVTVQLTSVGTATEFAKPTPTPRAPMTDDEFVTWFGKVLTAAGATDE